MTGRALFLATALLLSAPAADAAPAWSPACAHCAATFIVGGQRLHIEKRGAHGPIVLFQAGLGMDSSAWRKVAGPVSGFAQVVMYDRAGLGRSQPLAATGKPVTARAVADALAELLSQAGLRPPYILVGHSQGGIYMQMFARLHPADIAGMVLLDSASIDAPAGLTTRATLAPGSADYLEEAGVADSNRQVRQAGPFPPVPLTVIAATDHGPHFHQWESTLMRLQQQLATLSPRGRLVVAEGSGHDVATDRPALVIAAIRAMAGAMPPPP